MGAPKGHKPYAGGGHPRKFSSPEEIDKLSTAYFKEMDSLEKPYTITGLAESLGTFRIVLISYEKGDYDTDDKKYSDAIKRAKAKVERYAEEAVYSKTAGAVFTLVNLTRNSSEPWKNAQSTEVTGKDGSDLFANMTDEQLDARIAAALTKN